jgi:hypothetical protein
VDARLSVADVAPYGAWTVVPSFNYSGDNVNFKLGAGYGYQSQPIVEVLLDERGLVVTVDFFVRFSLWLAPGRAREPTIADRDLVLQD